MWHSSLSLLDKPNEQASSVCKDREISPKCFLGSGSPVRIQETKTGSHCAAAVRSSVFGRFFKTRHFREKQCFCSSKYFQLSN